MNPEINSFNDKEIKNIPFKRKYLRPCSVVNNTNLYSTFDRKEITKSIITTANHKKAVFYSHKNHFSLEDITNINKKSFFCTNHFNLINKISQLNCLKNDLELNFHNIMRENLKNSNFDKKDEISFIVFSFIDEIRKNV